MTVHDQLEALADTLETQGADPLRVQAVRRAYLFKRSWIDMAEALVVVRDKAAYKKWGYEDFHTYCANELRMTPATADKLTGSYSTMKRHAPTLLSRERTASSIPSCDAVDYFARALKGREGDDPEDTEDQVIAALREAVFEEGAPVTDLRRRFNPLLHEQTPDEEQVANIRRAIQTIRKLNAQLDGVLGLPKQRTVALQEALEDTRKDLVTLLERAKRHQKQRLAS